MSATIDDLRKQRETILRLAAAHGASNIRVFGSVARGEADDASDIDLLVDMGPDRSLLDLGGLLMDLERLCGPRVYVVTDRRLRTRIPDRVKAQPVPL